MEQIIIFTGIVVALVVIALGLTLDIVFTIYRCKVMEAHFEGILTEKEVEYFKKKYPEVSEEFIQMPQREQLVVNNKGIHNLNKRLDVTKEYIDKSLELIEAITKKLPEAKIQ